MRQANFETQQKALDTLGVSDYTRLCATLCADAESDFRNIEHPGVVHSSQGDHHSEGIYGQTLPWWTNDHYDIAEATAAFVKQLRVVSGDPVKDCYDVQHWDAPDYRTDLLAFSIAPETMNYSDRLATVGKLLVTKKLTG